MLVKGIYSIFQHYYHGGRIYFYSDPHFGDAEVNAFRHNYIGDDEQVKRINSKVGKNDTIIFLGDIGDISYIKKIRGYKVLIKGNHDTGVTNYIRTQDNHLFDEVYEGILTLSDKIVLSHEPIINLPEFLINIHGHNHAEKSIDLKHFNMCAEHIDYTPVALNDILSVNEYRKLNSIHRLTINKATEKRKAAVK